MSMIYVFKDFDTAKHFSDCLYPVPNSLFKYKYGLRFYCCEFLSRDFDDSVRRLIERFGGRPAELFCFKDEGV